MANGCQTSPLFPSVPALLHSPCLQVQGEEYGDDDLDPEWAGLLADLDARLQVRLRRWVEHAFVDGWTE